MTRSRNHSFRAHQSSSVHTARHASVSSSKSVQPQTHVQQSHPQQPQPLQPQSSLSQTIKEGFSFGVGSAVAHRMVNSVLGPSHQPVAPVALFEQCKVYTMETYKECKTFYPAQFNQCMRETTNDYELCKASHPEVFEKMG